MASVSYTHLDVYKRQVAGTLEVYRTKEGGGLILCDKAAGEKKPKDAQRVRLDIGIAFPDSFIADVAGGGKTTVTVYALSLIHI